MDFAQHRITTADGPFVYARDYAGATAHLPVVCLHGLTRNSADFDEVAPRIVALGRRVISVDARGRGRSDNDPDPARYRPDVYVGDVLRVFDTLGIARAVFLGTSMGGVMTMLAATIAPDRIGAAILNDIGTEVDPAGLARIASYVGKAGPFASWDEMTRAVRNSQSVAFPNRDEPFWRKFAHRVARERDDGRVEFAYDPAIANAFATAPPGAPPSMMPLFAALADKPVLLVRGALSDLLSAGTAAAMKQAKPDLAFVEVPGVGHAPTLEEPEAWSAIAAFLAEVE